MKNGTENFSAILFGSIHVYQFALIADTGSIRAAIAAGTIQDTSPITEETTSPRAIFLTVSATSRLPIGINVTR